MPEERLVRAWELLDSGDNESAQAEFARVVVEKPKDIDALVGLSKALSRLGRQDEALEVLEAALSLAPGNSEVHYGIGCVYYQDKRWHEAALHIQQAVAMAPDVAKYHLMAAECARRRKDMETALLHLEVANHIAPALFDGRARWILAYYRLFAGVEKLGLLMGWATLATIYACTFSAANLWWWFLVASVPFLAASGWNFRKRRYRRAIWALVLCVLWAVPAYLLVERLLSQ